MYLYKKHSILIEKTIAQITQNERFYMTKALHAEKIDYTNQNQLNDLLRLLQMYAKDPMGGGQEIEQAVLQKLPKTLATKPFMHSFVVYEDEMPIAFANCIESFSTFSGKGVLNIHDFAVIPGHRGKGISQFLMKKIEGFANSIDCNKLTLEVLEGNNSAVRAYQKFGFSAYQLNPEMGNAMFWQKNLS